MSLKSWWNSLFVFKESTLSTSGLPKVNCDVPMPEVKPLKSKKDISEPVLSFLEVYKARPKRFKLAVLWSEQENQYGYKDLVGFQLKDVVANKKFSLAKDFTYCILQKPTETGFDDEYVEHYTYRAIQNTHWMTQDERELVFEAIREERSQRSNNLIVRKEKFKRELLTKLYKGE